MPKELELVKQYQALAVTDQASLDVAGAALREIKAMMAEIAETFAEQKSLTHKAHKEVISAEKKHLAPLTEADAAIRLQVSDYVLSHDDAVCPDGISTMENFGFEIIDEKKIPRKYMTVDSSAIRKVVKAMGLDTKIPGIRVTNSRSLVVRK